MFEIDRKWDFVPASMVSAGPKPPELSPEPPNKTEEAEKNVDESARQVEEEWVEPWMGWPRA